MPLAVLAEEAYAATDPIPLADGDMIVLVTDGILEAPGENGSLFGAERLLELVRARRAECPRAIVDALYRAARDEGRGHPQSDDMTAIVIKVGDAGRAETAPGLSAP